MYDENATPRALRAVRRVAALMDDPGFAGRTGPDVMIDGGRWCIGTWRLKPGATPAPSRESGYFASEDEAMNYLDGVLANREHMERTGRLPVH